MIKIFYHNVCHIDQMNSKVVTRGQASGRRRGEALGLIVEQLPSPAELMQHRQKGKRSAEVQRAPALQPKMAAVLHHIGDLKRRQSSIDL